MLLTVLADAYWDDEENNRTVMRIHPRLAPVTAVICPLVKKDGLPEFARNIVEDLKDHYKVLYDQQGSIGKRYYRQDEAGTPFGITIDHQTLEDNTVTIRHRDTQKQDRINVDSLIEKLDDEIKNWS